MISKFTQITLLAGLLASVPAFAGLVSAATYTATQLTGSTWQYNLTVNDVGTTNVGTFWFAWVPGQDYMPTSPTSILSPAGWTSTITGGTANDGFAIRWVAGAGSAITAGNSLTGFQFVSATTPAQMAGASQFFANPPLTTSFVYSGAPFSDPGFSFVATAAATTPEPATAWLTLAGTALFLARRRFAQS